MNSTNNISARASYKIAKEVYFNSMQDKFRALNMSMADSQAWVDNLKWSQGEVRLEVQLAANTTNYKFGLIDSQANTTGVKFNTENRLTQQDTLVCNEIGLFVGKPASQTDTLWDLRTYGNLVDFSAGAAAAINQTLFSHGYLRMGVNNDVVIPYRGLFNHLYRPQTQETSALGAGSPNDQIRGAEDGFVTMEPNLFLIGSKGYIPEIILPNALATVDAFSRLVLIFRGPLAQNSTVVS